MDKDSIRYEPTWSSLRQHHTPQWMDNAKFGIYTHWTLRTIQLEHDLKYYREGIPLFSAEAFDPVEWAELFQRAGAQFAGPVAWHGTNFVHWNSKHTRWNTAQMGPKIDILGQLEKEIRERGMKFLASFHMGGAWFDLPRWEGHEEYSNEDYFGLYGPAHDTDATGPMHYQVMYENRKKSMMLMRNNG